MTQKQIDDIRARCDDILERYEGFNGWKTVSALVEDVRMLLADNGHLTARVEAVEAERDAAVEDLQIMANGVPCNVCKNQNKVPCTNNYSVEKCWEWRGSEAAHE